MGGLNPGLLTGAATEAKQDDIRSDITEIISVLSSIDLTKYKTLIDVASTTVTYFGFALPGTATSAETWRILKKSVSGTVTTFGYAGGVSTFTKTWDNRASYSYS